MGAVSKSSGAMLMLALLAAPATGGLAAQAQEQAQETNGEVMTTVYGQLPSPDQMTKGPKVEGIISARSDGRMQVTTADGNNTAIAIAE